MNLSGALHLKDGFKAGLSCLCQHASPELTALVAGVGHWSASLIAITAANTPEITTYITSVWISSDSAIST